METRSQRGSTGEETNSLALTLLEFLGDRASSFQVQIFGTDLNEKGIQKARAGIYRESIAEEISPERMARFFVKVDEGYRVNKAVRDMCVFARQNLAMSIYDKRVKAKGIQLTRQYQLDGTTIRTYPGDSPGILASECDGGHRRRRHP